MPIAPIVILENELADGVSIKEEEDEDSELSLHLEDRDVYTSCLSEPQPLYQIYMMQVKKDFFIEFF